MKYSRRQGRRKTRGASAVRAGRGGGRDIAAAGRTKRKKSRAKREEQARSGPGEGEAGILRRREGRSGKKAEQNKGSGPERAGRGGGGDIAAPGGTKRKSEIGTRRGKAGVSAPEGETRQKQGGTRGAVPEKPERKKQDWRRENGNFRCRKRESGKPRQENKAGADAGKRER